MDAYGWRRFTETEKVASANYYRRLGTHMNITSIPGTYREFSVVADAYGREHFAFEEGGRAVAESTLRLLSTFPPNHRLPAGLVRRACFALMDDPLLEAFGFPPVIRAVRVRLRLVRAARAPGSSGGTSPGPTSPAG
jgi:ER-bound oxygenase mpaB/B'/Rubber oxygenase, catalytic domain